VAPGRRSIRRRGRHLDVPPGPGRSLWGRVCGVGADDPVDLKHDSSRAEFEAAEAVRALKAQIAPWLEARMGGPARIDDDGDFVLDPWESLSMTPSAGFSRFSISNWSSGGSVWISSGDRCG
jgi:hypothetical protein